MIYYLVTAEDRITIDNYLFVQRSLMRFIKPLLFSTFTDIETHQAGTYLYSNVDRLSHADREAVIDTAISLDRRSDIVQWNHPVRALARYELLKKLQSENINTYNVYRPTENIEGLRYPIFVRQANDHLGPMSPLIHTSESLKQYLTKTHFPKSKKEDLIICEFCDTSDSEGIFRKYSAFNVAGKIVPRHLFFSQNWALKKSDLKDKRFIEEELSYIRQNPHGPELQEIFHTANIDFGRIDYAVLDGKLQVWEINMNPMILTPDMLSKNPRLEIHRHFANELMAQWIKMTEGMDKQKLVSLFLSAIPIGINVIRFKLSFWLQISFKPWLRIMLGLPERSK